MNYADTRCRVYDSEAVNMMGWAFDEAVRGLSEQSKADPNIHRNLALCIIRLFDEGERVPLHLSILALSIVAGSGRKRVSKERIAPLYPMVSCSPRTLMGGPWPPE